MFLEISIAETTKTIFDVCGNCLTASFFIDDAGHLVVSKYRFRFRENYYREDVETRTISDDYDKDTVKCIRFYFRDEVDAVLVKLSL
jgi:hypothetical protein